MNKIVVFCGSSVGFNPAYKEAAIALGKAFVENNITLVYGGGKIGMMGVIAETIMNLGGKVIGIIPELLVHEEVIYKDVTQVIVTKTMSERKVEMSKLADGYISLPGGYGTLDELFEGLTLSQLQIEQKPNAILNVNGYFDGLLKQLDHMVEEGFLKPHHRSSLLCSESIEDLLNQMKNYKAPEINPIINKVVKNDH